MPVEAGMETCFQSDCNRLKVYDCLVQTESDARAAEIYKGLTDKQKKIPSKYFYDAAGSKLFEEICRLPEYYPTRTELSILKRCASQIMGGFNEGDIVELGSGANWKIRTLIDSINEHERKHLRYVPVDVSRTALMEASEEMLEIYPALSIVGIVADFNFQLKLTPDRQRLFLFLGSTIGNLDEKESVRFLENVAGMMGKGDRFLLGLDMLKPVEIIEAAYNDSKGVTAKFNKNALKVLNREFDANFDLSHFDHHAFFNREKERVEMHLRANRNVKVEIGELDFALEMEKGDTIRTEICRKFSRESAGKMADSAGFKIAEWYTDEKGWFSLAMLERLKD